jgi:hypothetical protein
MAQGGGLELKPKYHKKEKKKKKQSEVVQNNMVLNG